MSGGAFQPKRADTGNSVIITALQCWVRHVKQQTPSSAGRQTGPIFNPAHSHLLLNVSVSNLPPTTHTQPNDLLTPPQTYCYTSVCAGPSAKTSPSFHLHLENSYSFLKGQGVMAKFNHQLHQSPRRDSLSPHSSMEPTGWGWGCWMEPELSAKEPSFLCSV